MSAIFTKSVLAISLLASLVAMSATANAGATISDKRYWPSEVGPGAYGAVGTQDVPRDAFAAIGRTASPVVAPAPAEEDTWHMSADRNPPFRLREVSSARRRPVGASVGCAGPASEDSRSHPQKCA